MAFTTTCRVCGSDGAPKNMVALFSPAGIKEDLPARITDLVQLPVDVHDGLPRSICQACKRRLVTLERNKLLPRTSRLKSPLGLALVMIIGVRTRK